MESKSLTSRLLLIVGLSVIAVIAGAAAASLVADSVISEFSSASLSASPVSARPTASVNVTRVSESMRAAVSIYRKRPGASSLDKVLLPSDEVGAGIVLTNDGWIALPASLLVGTNSLIAAFSDATTVILNPAKAVRDDATGVAFVKLDAQRLSVAPFGDDSALHAADPIFLADSASVITASVLSAKRLPVSVKADYLESSETLGRRIIMDHDGLPGMAAVDANGEIVGLSLGDGAAVPISFIEEVMRSVFVDGKAVRPKLGVRFVSLDTLPNAKDAGLDSTGALLAASGTARAVAKGSAAEAAGLKEGDVIIAVEHDRIDAGETLSERLQDYPPGAKIEFTVLRGGKQTKLNVILK
jgi:S1-C subfamily serine protease